MPLSCFALILRVQWREPIPLAREFISPLPVVNPISIPVVTLKGALPCALNANLALIASGLKENVSDMKDESFPLLNSLCQRKVQKVQLNDTHALFKIP